MSYSHSSISQQLKILEAEVGVPLLEPDGRRVRLTEQAEILVAHVEVILEQLDLADADLSKAEVEITGILRIAAFQTVIVALMPSVLTALRTDHPRLTVELSHVDPEEALSRLQVREFDLVFDEVFAGQSPARPGLVTQSVLHRDTMRLAVPPAGSPLADAQRVSDLAEADWVMEPAGSRPREWAERICRAAGYLPKVRYESPDIVVHERLVREGHAVAFLPDLLWVETLPTVGLHHLPESGYRDIICSVRAGTSDHPSVAAAMSALHVAVRALGDR
jgi:DNA-binding transcriptional LysR family regulator